MNDILFALWFFAPAGFANFAPILANNIPALKSLTQPMDFNKTFRGKRIFGSHKTFRGLFSGILMGALVAFLQYLLYRHWIITVSENQLTNRLAEINYDSPGIVLMGAAMGCGALIGDAIKSFFKRQLGVTPGKSWVPFDQIDFIIGGLVFAIPFVSFSFGTYVTIFIVMALLHPVFNLLGWVLKMKDNPF